MRSNVEPLRRMTLILCDWYISKCCRYICMVRPTVHGAIPCCRFPARVPALHFAFFLSVGEPPFSGTVWWVDALRLRAAPSRLPANAAGDAHCAAAIPAAPATAPSGHCRPSRLLTPHLLPYYSIPRLRAFTTAHTFRAT